MLLKTREINEKKATPGEGWTLEIGNDVARAIKYVSHLEQLRTQGQTVPKDPKPL